MTQPTWIRKLQITYGITLAVWLLSVAGVATAAVKIGDWSGMGILAAFAPGLIYFFITSMRFKGQSDEDRAKSLKRLFVIQSATGIPALIGAILGFLPAVINIPMYYTMAPIDQTYNAGMMLPWQMVYFFTITYLVVAAIRRGLKAETAALNAAEAKGAGPAPEPVPVDESPTPESEKPVEATAELPAAPVIRKLPIAPALFFVLGILLLLFTISLEVKAYEAARAGNLTDLASPGFEFSFYQFIDLFLGNAAAIVVIVFGIINWPRDDQKVRKVSTPLMGFVALAITPGSIGLALVGATGVSPETELRNEHARIAWAWIQDVAGQPAPEGFEQVDGLMDCGSGESMCDDPDSAVTFTRIGDHESNAEYVCTSAVAWAFKTGATTYAIAPDYTPTEFTAADSEPAITACVKELTTPDTVANAMETYSPVFRFIGKHVDTPYQMDLQEIRWGEQSTDPGARNYVLTVATTYQPDDLLPGQDQLSAGTHELNDLLTAIGQARLANPDTDPNDATLIRGALKTYTHDIPIKPIVDADGKIRFLELTTSDEPEVQCLSIAPWDEEYNGIPDPGTGYGISSAENFADLKAHPMFGAQAWGKCSK